MQAYGFQFCGNCLGAVIPNGSDVEVDPTLEIRPLDVVAVLLDPDAWRGPLPGSSTALAPAASWASARSISARISHGMTRPFISSHSSIRR
jgi:hypothetical protein